MNFQGGAAFDNTDLAGSDAHSLQNLWCVHQVLVHTLEGEPITHRRTLGLGSWFRKEMMEV